MSFSSLVHAQLRTRMVASRHSAMRSSPPMSASRNRAKSGEIRIRAFDPRDTNDVLRMVRGLYVDDPSPHAPGDEQVRRTLGVITDERRGAVWLADDGDGTPPFAYLFLTKVWSNELGGDLVFIDELWVARERRSQGVGSALVEHGIATTKGAVAFELEVSPSNHRARSLYERLGFRPLRNTSLRRVL
jgi:ribosomal protein S18 acetylase RimI-like enzyme